MITVRINIQDAAEILRESLERRFKASVSGIQVVSYEQQVCDMSFTEENKVEGKVYFGNQVTHAFRADHKLLPKPRSLAPRRKPG